ncbi:unnamed protein product [Cuscuta epithymum]|uniref:UVR domain-containing protein n=2 Tax=Cuscuta epithymum TaxID=186058 RepID=A0AAV0CW39_9ASTE|nr:unnamed protein product [Cuscuta epithymum]
MEENDEMDSLFEGMVLFDPSEMVSGDPDIDDVGIGHLDRRGSDIAAVVNVGAAQPAVPPIQVPAQSNHIQPLDENLFSDLTLVSPPRSPEVEDFKSPPGPSSNSVLSRQNSTARKKKRAGLRIGYGRNRYYASDSVPTTSPPGDHSKEGKEKGHNEELEKEEEDSYAAEEGEEHDSTIISAAHDCDSQKTSRSIHSNDDALSHKADSLGSCGVGENVTSEQLNCNKSHKPVELRFEQLKTLISSKLKMANETVASISSEKKESIRKRRKAARNVTQAFGEYKELEKKLDEACEAEDFEKAERVSESLALAEKEKERLTVDLRDAEAQSSAVDSKMQEALDSLIHVEEECASMLQSFALDAICDAELDVTTAEGLSSKQMQEWELSAEAIEIQKMELEIEAELVFEAQKVLKDSIEQYVEDDRRERNILCKKKEVLTEELKQLLALVKAKEEEIAENDSLIEKVDRRIDCVMSSSQEAETSINENYQNLQSRLSELLLENESLLEKKKEIDYYASQEESRKAKIRDLSRISADEANMFTEVVGLRKSLAQFVLKSKEDRVRLSINEDELAIQIQMLQQQISAARTSLQELSSSKSKIQQDIDSSKQRFLLIDKRVPELEAEKKVAAAARNFKEAARLSTEAKELCMEKDRIQTKLEGAELEVKKVEEEICLIVERLKETEAQVSEKERELAMARFQRLILVDRACREERSVALELGDLEEADALLEEAEAAVSEARKLQPIYGFQEELITLPKHFISAELVSKLQGRQLAELAASVNILAS